MKAVIGFNARFVQNAPGAENQLIVASKSVADASTRAAAASKSVAAACGRGIGGPVAVKSGKKHERRI